MAFQENFNELFKECDYSQVLSWPVVTLGLILWLGIRIGRCLISRGFPIWFLVVHFDSIFYFGKASIKTQKIIIKWLKISLGWSFVPIRLLNTSIGRFCSRSPSFRIRI